MQARTAGGDHHGPAGHAGQQSPAAVTDGDGWLGPAVSFCTVPLLGCVQKGVHVGGAPAGHIVPALGHGQRGIETEA